MLCRNQQLQEHLWEINIVKDYLSQEILKRIVESVKALRIALMTCQSVLVWTHWTRYIQMQCSGRKFVAEVIWHPVDDAADRNPCKKIKGSLKVTASTSFWHAGMHSGENMYKMAILYYQKFIITCNWMWYQSILEFLRVGHDLRWNSRISLHFNGFPHIPPCQFSTW